MHCIFNIREILDEIFSWMSTGELIVAMCVNNIWFEESARRVWETATISTVVSVLNQANNTTTWNRFLLYGRSVVNLKGHHDNYIYVTNNAIPPVSEWPKFLFPRCRFLKWGTGYNDDDLINLDNLIPPSLECLSLKVYDLEPMWFHRLCETLTNRLSVLRVFKLSVTDPSREAANCIASFHKLLDTFASSLEHVQLPDIFATEATFEKLHNIRRLKALRFNTGLRTQIVDISSSEPSDLPSLEILSFGALVSQSLVDSFLKRFTLSSLTVLHYTEFPLINEWESLITHVVKSCPQLEAFDITGSRTMNPPVIPWREIQPILACKALHVFALRCFRVTMDLGDFQEFLSSRGQSSTWTKIDLCSVEPWDLIEAMSLLARYCPRLGSLGIHVQANSGIRTLGHLDNAVPESSMIQGDVQIPEPQLESTEEYRILFQDLISIDLEQSEFLPDSAQALAEFLWNACSQPFFITGKDPEFFLEVHDFISSFLATTEAPVSDDVRKYRDGHRKDLVEYISSATTVQNSIGFG